MSTQQDDLFDDETSTTETPEAEDNTEADAVKETSEENTEGVAEEEAQGENTEETPNSEEDAEDKTEKMIPESRLKAALNDVNSKLEAANARLAELTATPAPDRNTDPDGYDLHMRIETSKQIMADLHPDYDETIQHFQELAKADPTLNAAVVASKNPAKLAYDIAKRDKEIKEIVSLKNSDRWKKFEQWEREQANSDKQKTQQPSVIKKANVVATKVPNLNRSTNVSRQTTVQKEDDDLFAGAAF
jgi:hypothetical protein